MFHRLDLTKGETFVAETRRGAVRAGQFGPFVFRAERDRGGEYVRCGMCDVRRSVCNPSIVPRWGCRFQTFGVTYIVDGDLCETFSMHDNVFQAGRVAPGVGWAQRAIYGSASNWSSPSRGTSEQASLQVSRNRRSLGPSVMQNTRRAARGSERTPSELPVVDELRQTARGN
jgi:hypothetical protein